MYVYLYICDKNTRILAYIMEKYAYTRLLMHKYAYKRVNDTNMGIYAY